jgi:hypothetical protein
MVFDGVKGPGTVENSNVINTERHQDTQTNYVCYLIDGKL